MTLTQYGCQVAIAVYQAIHQRLLNSGSALMYPDELASIVAGVQKTVEVYVPVQQPPVGIQQQQLPVVVAQQPAVSTTATPATSTTATPASPFAAGKLTIRIAS